MRQLHDYQKRGVEFILSRPNTALFMEMGLGKTVTTLTAVKVLMDDLDIGCVLVVAPKRVAESVWSAEVREWEHLKDLRVERISGDENQRVAALRRQADIYTIGRDNLVWLVKRIGRGASPFDMLVLDELSSFKNREAKRWKAARVLAAAAKRVVGLTGTPAGNGLMDLWAQIFLLDRGERLGRTITGFRDQYFVPEKRNGAIIYSYKLKPFAEEEIHTKVQDIALSMKAEDYLQLPERIDIVRRIELEPGALYAYKKLEKESVLALEQGEVTALNAAALMTKLLQIAGGVVYDAEGVARELHDSKLEELEELMEESGEGPVLVAWTFRHDRDRIMKRFAQYKPVELKGEEDIRRWNRGEIKMLLLHPASGGHGLNLQAGGSIIVWYGLSWSLELDQQLNARLHRQGQIKPVRVYRLVVGGTVDEDVLQALERKSAGQEALMQALKERAKKYFENI